MLLFDEMSTSPLKRGHMQQNHPLNIERPFGERFYKTKGSLSSRNSEVQRELKEAEEIMVRGFHTARELNKFFELSPIKAKSSVHRRSIGLQVELQNNDIPKVVQVCHKCIMSTRKENKQSCNTGIINLQEGNLGVKTAKLAVQRLPSVDIKGQLTCAVLPQLDLIPSSQAIARKSAVKVVSYTATENLKQSNHEPTKVDANVQTSEILIKKNNIKEVRKIILKKDVENLKKQINETWKLIENSKRESQSHLKEKGIDKDYGDPSVDKRSENQLTGQYESDFEVDTTILDSPNEKNFEIPIKQFSSSGSSSSSSSKASVSHVKNPSEASLSSIVRFNNKSKKSSPVNFSEHQLVLKEPLNNNTSTNSSSVHSPSKERFNQIVKESRKSTRSDKEISSRSESLKLIVPNIVLQLPEVDSAQKEATLLAIETLKKHFEKTESLLERLTEEKLSTLLEDNNLKENSNRNVGGNSKFLHLPLVKSKPNINSLHKRSFKSHYLEENYSSNEESSSKLSHVSSSSGCKFNYSIGEIS